jgi:hypothetical protein
MFLKNILQDCCNLFKRVFMSFEMFNLGDDLTSLFFRLRVYLEE